MDKICLDLHGAVCLQQTWRVDPGRFCPSIFEKTPWTKSAWIYTVLFAYNKHGAEIQADFVLRFLRMAMDRICLDLRGAVCLQKAWRVGPGRFYPSMFWRKGHGQDLPGSSGAVCLQKAWRVGPGRFYPSMFCRKGHGQDLPGSTRCCLLAKSMARRSRQILSFDVLAKRPWTRSAWIYAVLFAYKKHGA